MSSLCSQTIERSSDFLRECLIHRRGSGHPRSSHGGFRQRGCHQVQGDFGRGRSAVSAAYGRDPVPILEEVTTIIRDMISSDGSLDPLSSSLAIKVFYTGYLQTVLRFDTHLAL
jgi:hypothetical protein